MSLKPYDASISFTIIIFQITFCYLYISLNLFSHCVGMFCDWWMQRNVRTLCSIWSSKQFNKRIVKFSFYQRNVYNTKYTYSNIFTHVLLSRPPSLLLSLDYMRCAWPFLNVNEQHVSHTYCCCCILLLFNSLIHLSNAHVCSMWSLLRHTICFGPKFSTTQHTVVKTHILIAVNLSSTIPMREHLQFCLFRCLTIWSDCVFITYNIPDTCKYN